MSVKRPERETDRLPPSSVKVKKEWSCTSVLSLRLHGESNNSFASFHSIDCCFVSGSQWYNQVSSVVTNSDRKSFGSRRAEKKFPKVVQTTGSFDVFHPRSGISGPTSRRASECPNLHE